MTVDPHTVRITWQAMSPALRATVEDRCTPRQAQVIMLYAAGHGPREVARYLGISHVTVMRIFEAGARRVRQQATNRPNYEGVVETTSGGGTVNGAL